MRNKKFPLLVPVFVLNSHEFHEFTGKKPNFMHNNVAQSGTCFSVVQSLFQLKSAAEHVNDGRACSLVYFWFYVALCVLLVKRQGKLQTKENYKLNKGLLHSKPISIYRI